MKKVLLSLLVLSTLVLSVLPGVFATSVGSGIGVGVSTEDFAPQVWQCDGRVVYDDGTEPGRISNDGTKLVERINNYAFEGEQIRWDVLVMDKNGKEKVSDVYATVNDGIEANCKAISKSQVSDSCNARILEEEIDEFDSETMQYYTCLLTVETPQSMYGPADVTIEVEDLDGIRTTMDETERWFLNPVVELGVSGSLNFDNVRPGTSSYSDQIILSNDADAGVSLDMFISGTDFYDSASSGAKCGTSNQLKLKNFRYYATNGAYSTRDDLEIDSVVQGNDRDVDDEGYVNIDYGTGFNDPAPFYDNMEIIQAQHQSPYYVANVLNSGSEMALTFRLDLPEPCNGDFDSGSIYFWGEAI